MIKNFNEFEINEANNSKGVLHKTLTDTYEILENLLNQIDTYLSYKNMLKENEAFEILKNLKEDFYSINSDKILDMTYRQISNEFESKLSDQEITEYIKKFGELGILPSKELLKNLANRSVYKNKPENLLSAIQTSIEAHK